MKQIQEQAATAEVSRESSERQVRELQRHIDEIERVGVRQLKNEIRVLERKVFYQLLTCMNFICASFHAVGGNTQLSLVYPI